MRTTMIATLISVIAFSASAMAEDKVVLDGFTPLFNGKDFTGWSAKQGQEESAEEQAKWREHWKVEDGVIKFDGKGPHLWTSDKYGDFVLVVDWRLPKPGDSGIYLRGKSKSQVNIWCRDMGSGEVWGYRTDNSQPEEIRAACTPSKKMDKPVGEWNTFVITMKGDRLTVDLNGEVVINGAPLPGVPEKGEIALQRHGNPIEFRNLFVKRLEAE